MRGDTHTHAIARTYTTQRGTRTHEHTVYTKLNLHNLKRAANRDLRRMKTEARNGKHGRQDNSFGKRNVLRSHLNESERLYCLCPVRFPFVFFFFLGSFNCFLSSFLFLFF